jgi:hypothetical protein
MSLASGSRLGPYEVIAPIGAVIYELRTVDMVFRRMKD